MTQHKMSHLDPSFDQFYLTRRRRPNDPGEINCLDGRNCPAPPQLPSIPTPVLSPRCSRKFIRNCGRNLFRTFGKNQTLKASWHIKVIWYICFSLRTALNPCVHPWLIFILKFPNINLFCAIEIKPNYCFKQSGFWKCNGERSLINFLGYQNTHKNHIKIILKVILQLSP